MSDIKRTLSNYEIEHFVEVLSNFFDCNGRFGYAIARNYRKLSSTALEYFDAKHQLVKKYGIEDFDSNGNSIGYVIEATNPYYQEVSKELNDLGNIEHEVVIFEITYDDLPEDLSARDIISLEWMIQE